MGKAVTIEPLPSPNWESKLSLYLLEEGDERTHPEQSTITQLKEIIERDVKEFLSVPKKLSNPDKLIIAAKANLTQKDRGYGRYDGLVQCSNGFLDIRVTPVNIERALRFMDTTIKLLRSRGHDITVSDEDTFAIIEGENVKIAFREKIKRVERPARKSYERSFDEVPTGILSFKMIIFFKETEWKDGQKPLEEQLSDILAKMEIKSKAHRTERAIWRKENEERKEKERQILEQKQKIEKDAANFRDLINEAQKWQQTTTLRNYLNEIESKAIASGIISEGLKNWLKWARQKTDSYDPINSRDGKDELLSLP